MTFLVGIPFGYLGAIVRYYYGPDSPYAVFEPNTCSALLGLPTCGMWVVSPSIQACIQMNDQIFILLLFQYIHLYLSSCFSLICSLVARRSSSI